MNNVPIQERSRRHGRRLASLVLTLAAIMALGAPACSSSKDVASGLAEAETCSLNSDCASGLICALSKCRVMCVTAADCGDGGSCIDNGDIAVCQKAAEKNTPCDKESDCPTPLACASDYRCRNLCSDSASCNVLGIKGRVCAKDANGVDYCAEPSEVKNGILIALPPPGAPDSGVIEPVEDAASHEASSTTMTDGAAGAPGVDGSAGDGSATAGDAAVTCNPPCGVGFQCANGSCVACGANGQACCGGGCDPNLTCDNGMCACGGPGLACCGNTACNGGVACVSGMCACGGAGQACCPGDGGSSTCSGSLTCTGTKCGCIAAVDQGLVRRTDGTLWYYANSSVAPVAILTSTNTKFVATSSADGETFGCGVQNGNVWCWDYTGTDNTNGKLGNGTATGSTLPSQVLTSVTGPPLANVTKVFAASSGDNLACAIDAAGSVWCWGNGSSGSLGNGSTNNSTFAVPVLTQAGGAQFSGVATMALSTDHACAVKTDRTLWCWGNNASGQIGVGSTQASYLYPVQVSTLMNHVVSVSLLRYAALSMYENMTCATTDDGGLWCWGSNTDGLLGNGRATGQSLVPVQVEADADGGAPFGGAAQVQCYYAQYAVVRKSADGSLWSWGSTRLVPAPYTEGNTPVTGAISLIPTSGGYPEFIAFDGTLHMNGGAVTMPIPCP